MSKKIKFDSSEFGCNEKVVRKLMDKLGVALPISKEARDRSTCSKPS